MERFCTSNRRIDVQNDGLVFSDVQPQGASDPLGRASPLGCVGVCRPNGTAMCDRLVTVQQPMSDINVALALLGGLILVLSLGAGLLHRGVRVVSEPMITLAIGVLVGPLGIGLFDPAAWGDEILLVEQAARLTIAIAVTSIALRLPEDYFRRRVRAMATILGPGMIGMWLASAAVVYVVLDLRGNRPTAAKKKRPEAIPR